MNDFEKSYPPFYFRQSQIKSNNMWLALNIVISASCLMLILLCSTVTTAQPYPRYNPCDPRYAYGIRPPCATIAGTAAKILSDLTKLRSEKIKFNNQIEQARQRFFKEYPNGPNRAEAQREFAHLLFQKDFWLFYLAFQAGGGETYGSKEASIALDKFTGLGVELDNGIRPLAFDSFYEWTSFYYQKVMGSPTNRQINSLDDFINKIALGAVDSEAHQASMDEYERYRLARDWAEFAAAGYSLTDNPKDYLITLFIIERPYNQKPEKSNAEQAAEFYQLMAKVVGEEAMLKAAKQLMSAQKGQSYRITVNGESLQPYTAFKSFLADASKRASVMTILSDIRREISLESADKEYKQLVAAYGENALFDAAAQVHRAYKEYGDNFAGIKKSLGVQRVSQDTFVFEDLLLNQDPKGYVRAILAFKKNLSTVAEVDAAYAKLTATYGEQAVKSAGEKIVAFWKSTLPFDTPKEYQDILQKYLLGLATYEYPDSQVPTSPTPRGKAPGGKPTNTGVFNSGFGVYGLLIGLMDGSKTIPRAVTEADYVINPGYLAWAKFPVGTTVTFAYSSWIEQGKQIDPRTNRNPNPYKGLIQTYRLTELNAQGVKVVLSEKSFSPEQPRGVVSQDQGFAARVMKRQYEKPKTIISESSGTETLEINGKTYQCEWGRTIYGHEGVGAGSPDYTTIIETVWSSDQVPGGFVRKRREESSGDGRVFIQEEVLQPFKVDDLAALVNPPTVSFRINPDIALGSSEADALAKAGEVKVATTVANSSIPPQIPEDSSIFIITVDAIDQRGIDSNKRFQAKLEKSLKFGGEIILPKGTDVFLKARRREDGVNIGIMVDYIVIGGNRITVKSSEIFQMPQTVQSKDNGKGAGNGGILRLPRLPVIIPRIPGIPRQPKENTSEQDKQIPPQTRTSFMISQL